jgi:hypothetical protein
MCVSSKCISNCIEPIAASQQFNLQKHTYITIEETSYTNFGLIIIIIIILLSDSQRNYTAQPTWSHQTQSRPIPNITYPGLGVYNGQVNLPVSQFVNSPSILDTGASECRPVTESTSSLVNPNIITNSLCLVPAVNARSLLVPSDQTNSLLKRAGTIENGLAMDAREQHVTRQTSEDASSGNGIATGTGSQNLALTADLTRDLTVDRDMVSGANQHWSGINMGDLDSDLDPIEISIVEDLLKQLGHHS